MRGVALETRRRGPVDEEAGPWGRGGGALGASRGWGPWWASWLRPWSGPSGPCDLGASPQGTVPVQSRQRAFTENEIRSHLEQGLQLPDLWAINACW